jgi:hypothetical protein
MALPEIRKVISKSLRKGETREDFESMLSIVSSYKRPYLQEMSQVELERLSGIFICLLVMPKPPQYILAMSKFRFLFKGISVRPRLQEIFHSALLPSIRSVTGEGDIKFRPSEYFDINSIGLIQPATQPPTDYSRVISEWW